MMILWLVCLLGSYSDIPRPLEKPQILGRVQKKYTLDAETVFTVDGKIVYGMSSIPRDAIVDEINIDEDNRVRLMRFKNKEK